MVHRPSRRRFLGYVIGGPTLVTAARWAGAPAAEAAPGQTLPSVGPQVAESYDLIDFLRDAARPTANLLEITVNDDGTVEFDLHRTEVGQGVNTAVAMIIADEMDVPLENVRISQADARPALLFNQLTGGSNSIYTIYDPVRMAAAVARQRLIDAAAIQLESAGSELGIVDGIVRAPDGSSLGIGELARKAASLTTELVENVQPKEGDRLFVGKPTNRIDARAMVTGEQKYTLDLDDVPDAVPVMVARPTTIMGTPVRVRNEAEVLAVPGVQQLAIVEFGVAIAADTFGHCIDALQVIDVEWADGPATGLSDDSVSAALAEAELPLPPKPDLPLLQGGPLGLNLLPVPQPLVTTDFSFDFAFQPNCPLETNPCVARVTDESAEIWGPMKTPLVAKQDIAEALGLPQSRVAVHVVQGGGSFGRNLFWDAAREAALISRAMRRPVKLSWTRTDDFRQGRVHPANRSTVRITHNNHEIVNYAQHHTSVNTDYGHGLGEIITRKFDELPSGVGGLGFSQTVFFLTQYVPYNFGVVEQLLNETLPAVGELETNIFRTGSMRNIYSPNVVTARELAVDQVAEQLRRDPYEFRWASLKDARSRAVLGKVAAAGNWGRTMEPGTAQGIGFHSEYKGRAACLVEIDCRPETVGRTVESAPYGYTGPRVTKAIYAVDVGLAINPKGLEAQMIGGMMDGIANALSYSLHLDGGAYAEDSWEHAYYTRQWNTPFETEVYILDSSEQPGGAGEFGVAASMAATACAYARATGTMPTKFPINHDMPLAESIVPQGVIPQSPTDGLANL